MSYTLFVILPSQDVCSLRRLAPCSSVRAVRKKLEVTSGLPAQTYDLTCPDGKLLEDDTLLRLDQNVWDGYVMRAVFKGVWQDLYNAVVAGDVEEVLEHCTSAVHGKHVPSERDQRGPSKAEAEDRETETEPETRERGAVALYLASFLGSAELCDAVLNVGVSPNSRTPFGRTPMFAAMSGDHVHILELLLSRQALLEARDMDGTSTLDVARELQAKECLRKVRHLKLFNRAGSAASSMASRASARESERSAGRKGQPRVIRIPTATPDGEDVPGGHGNGSETAGKSCEDGGLSPDSRRAVKSYEDGGLSGEQTVKSDEQDGCPSPSRSDSSVKPREPKSTDGASKAPATPTPGSRPSPWSLFRHTEVYAWDNHLRPVSRASSAAGTQVRIPVPANRGERLSSGRSSSRASNGQGVTCSDTAVSASSGTAKRLSLRPSVQDLSIAGPTVVLKVPGPVTPPQTNDTPDRNLPDAESLQTALKHQETTLDADKMEEPHCPAVEPPARPPSRNDKGQAPMGEESSVLAGSIYISVPDMRGAARGDSDALPDQQPGITGDTPIHHKESRHSPTAGPNLAGSRRTQHASWRTMKRRLKLAEEQKRAASPRSTASKQKSPDKETAKPSFEDWLERKRKEKERHSDSSETESSSSEDEEERLAENEKAFNDWLKDLKDRQIRGPHPFAAASLHRRKSRPLKNLIQVGGNTEETVAPPEPDTYMTAYREWRRRKSSTTDSEEQLTSPRDIKAAKKRVENQRKSLLAMALTYEDWLEHSEQRQKLMQAILREDSNKIADTEQTTLRTRRAPSQISFDEWRERVARREAELRQLEKEHLRRQEESQLYDKFGYLVIDGCRSSRAIPHDEWLKKKKGESLKKKQVQKASEENSRCSVVVAKKQDTLPKKGQEERPSTATKQKRSASVSEDGKENSAWEMWLQRKHEKEMERLSRNLYEGKQLMLNGHQKKTARVTQC